MYGMVMICMCFSCEDLDTNTCIYLQLNLLMCQPDSRCYHMMLHVSSSLTPRCMANDLTSFLAGL